MAEPDVRPPGAANPSGKSIWVIKIPLAAMDLRDQLAVYEQYGGSICAL